METGQRGSSLISWVGAHLHELIAPDKADELPTYYLFWILLYVAVNVFWDVRSPRTPTFHISMMRDKVSVLHNAVTFTSSLILITGAFSQPTRQLVGDTLVPILLAGLSGLFVTLGELCPYKLKDVQP